MNLSQIEKYGQAWFVCLDLAGAGTTEIVTPTPLRRDPTNGVADRFCEENQIIVLGFVATVVGGAGAGFYIQSRGQDNLPRVHYRYANGSTVATVVSVPSCYMPLQKADLNTSPSMDPHLLEIQTIGTCTLGSCISIWGIHTTHDFGNRGYTGSPVVFPA